MYILEERGQLKVMMRQGKLFGEFGRGNRIKGMRFWASGWGMIKELRLSIKYKRCAIRRKQSFNMFKTRWKRF